MRQIPLLTLTDSWISQVSGGVLVKVRLTEFTVQTVCVMHTVITYTATDVTPGVVDSRIKVAAIGVFVTFALYKKMDIAQLQTRYQKKISHQ